MLYHDMNFAKIFPVLLTVPVWIIFLPCEFSNMASDWLAACCQSIRSCVGKFLLTIIGFKMDFMSSMALMIIVTDEVLIDVIVYFHLLFLLYYQQTVLFVYQAVYHCLLDKISDEEKHTKVLWVLQILVYWLMFSESPYLLALFLWGLTLLAGWQLGADTVSFYQKYMESLKAARQCLQVSLWLQNLIWWSAQSYFMKQTVTPLPVNQPWRISLLKLWGTYNVTATLMCVL